MHKAPTEGRPSILALPNDRPMCVHAQFEGGKKTKNCQCAVSVNVPKLIQGLKLLHKAGGQSCARPGEGAALLVYHTPGESTLLMALAAH